jgi:hypothetical protein
MPESKEVQPQNAKTLTGVEASLDRMEQFHEYMRRRAADEATQRPESLAQEIAARNADQIFAAAMSENGSIDDIWNAGSGGTIQARDCFNNEGGLEIQIRSFRPDLSKRVFEDGNEASHGYYITCDATVLGGPASLLRQLGLSIGEEFALQTGADDIVFRLRAFELRNALPVSGVITGVKTSRDFNVVKFRPLPKRAQTGTVAP